eukprot:155486-Chlamydomonas_euryale.AAC.3
MEDMPTPAHLPASLPLFPPSCPLQLCSEEKAVFCKEVQPGRARVVKCLMENMAQPNFGEECSEELQKREEVMKSDYR